MKTLRPPRAGMTLIELLVAITIFGVVVSTSVAFMAKQNTAFQDAVNRLVALRNLRYAITTLSQDLETLGTNVPDIQPTLFYADDDVIAFSSDYATNVADDPFAVFHDPDAPSGQVTAPAVGFSIPNSAEAIPDSIYEAVPGVRSPAEVLIFFVQADTGTARTDDYILFRQVNNNTPEVIARNLLKVGSNPFFSYSHLTEMGYGAKTLGTVPDSLLPIHHSAIFHLSQADTARSAFADSIRAVEVHLGATNGLSGPEEEVVELERLIPLPNAGFGQLATCGSRPLLGTTLSAANGSLPGGEPVVNLSWSPATDETGGEADVVRYVLWRRETGTTSWGDPYRAIPAGASSYSYQDAAVTPSKSYDYALAAQDCTPTLSTLTTTGPVIIP